jgi:translation initiation factor 2 gamma subunit (eIF-2gamma)
VQEVSTRHFVIATAGHVDHGKSALVKALTGTDPDRLPEEKARKITIELGFAELNLTAPNGQTIHAGIIDVPGHEDFVRNMIAGVGSIDLALFVVAADDAFANFDVSRSETGRGRAREKRFKRDRYRHRWNSKSNARDGFCALRDCSDFCPHR